MTFTNDKAIYLQMADRVCDEILADKCYFVTKGAKQQILKVRKKEFMDNKLPEFFRQMKLLGINKEEVCNLFDQYNV